MSLWKIRPKCSPIHIWSKLIHNFYQKKKLLIHMS
jgi:hypothetical protein